MNRAVHLSTMSRPPARPDDTLVCEHFPWHMEEYLPGARYVEDVAVIFRGPNGFIELDGVTHPVEISEEAFDAENLARLQGFIASFGLPAGVAVGTALACELPANVGFVEVR